MAKLLKHLGIGVKKTSSPSQSSPSSSGVPISHRSTPSSSSVSSVSQRIPSSPDYCSGTAPKSTSVQELQPKSPTRYRSSGSLSSNTNHESYDTQSLKSFFDGQQRSSHDPRPASCSSSQHGASSGSHAGGRSHRGPTGSDRGGGLSPKGCVGGSDGHYPAAYGTSVMSVTEESEVFDSSPVTAGSRLPDLSTSATHAAAATPPQLTDEYCDPVDLRNQLAESADLLGVCAQVLPIDDDYSVPYEVKKIVKDVKSKDWTTSNGNSLSSSVVDNRFHSSSISASNSSNITTTTVVTSGPATNNTDMIALDDSLDEPWEWTSKLNSLVQNSPLYNGNSSSGVGERNGNCTPLITHKKQDGCSSGNVSKKIAEKNERRQDVVDNENDTKRTNETNGNSANGDAKEVAPTGKNFNMDSSDADIVVKVNNGKLERLCKPDLPGISSTVLPPESIQTCSAGSVLMTIKTDFANPEKREHRLSGIKMSPADRPNKLSSGGSLIVSPSLNEIAELFTPLSVNLIAPSLNPPVSGLSPCKALSTECESLPLNGNITSPGGNSLSPDSVASSPKTNPLRSASSPLVSATAQTAGNECGDALEEKVSASAEVLDEEGAAILSKSDDGVGTVVNVSSTESRSTCKSKSKDKSAAGGKQNKGQGARRVFYI